MMQRVNAALLGVDHPHSKAHLRTLQALDEVESIFLWDDDADALAATVAEQSDKVAGTFTDLELLLGRDDLFFAIAAIRNDLGPEVFLCALEAGKHLMAEKPIGKNAADTQRVLEAAQAAGVQLGVCYQNRANPVIRDVRKLVAQGLLGPLISIEMRMITTQVQFRNPQNWLFNHAQSGGGILSWLGCHNLDMLHYVTGDEVVSVAAELATRSGEAIDVEDAATLSMRLRSGAVASFHAGYMLALSGSGYHNRSGYDTYMGINGRLGRITWSSTGQPTEVHVESVHPDWAAAPQRTFQYEYGVSPAYGGVYGEQFIRQFIQAAQGTADSPAPATEALRVAHIVDAAYESNQSGQRVDVAAVR